MEFFKLSQNKDVKVDMEARVIRSVIVADTIKPKDSRNFQIDEDFIAAYMKLVKGSKQKTEFNHNYSSRLGLRVGYVSDFTTDGSKIMGNLYVYSAADASPVYPGMGDFVLKSVKEDPESMMLSLKVGIGAYYGTDAKGKKREVKQMYNWETGPYYVYKDNGEVHNGIVTGMPVSANGVDIVSEGALTNSMFGIDENFSTEQDFDMLLHDKNFRKWLNNFHKGIAASEEVMNNEMNILKLIQRFFKMDKQSQIKEKEQQMAALQAEIATLKGDTSEPAPTQVAASTQTPAPTQVAASTQTPAPAAADTATIEAAIKAAMATQTKTIEDLQAEIKALKGSPAGEHAGQNGGGGLDAGQKTSKFSQLPAYLQLPHNARFVKQYCIDNGLDPAEYGVK